MCAKNVPFSLSLPNKDDFLRSGVKSISEVIYPCSNGKTVWFLFYILEMLKELMISLPPFNILDIVARPPDGML